MFLTAPTNFQTCCAKTLPHLGSRRRGHHRWVVIAGTSGIPFSANMVSVSPAPIPALEVAARCCTACTGAACSARATGSLAGSVAARASLLGRNLDWRHSGQKRPWHWLQYQILSACCLQFGLPPLHAGLLHGLPGLVFMRPSVSTTPQPRGQWPGCGRTAGTLRGHTATSLAPASSAPRPSGGAPGTSRGPVEPMSGGGL